MNEVESKLSINALQVKTNDKPSNSQRRNRKSDLEKKRTKTEKQHYWLRTDKLTETQIRDIETNGIDIGSERVRK